jgi:hypothetical protein
MSLSPISDLLEEGLALHRRGAVRDAAARYAEVLRADPAHVDAHYYLATISCQQGRFDEGAEPLRSRRIWRKRTAIAATFSATLAAMPRRSKAMTARWPWRRVRLKTGSIAAWRSPPSTAWPMPS